MDYIKQIIYDLRHQPMVTWITVTGTALSIFLVMAVFMVNRVNVASVQPESERQRIVYGLYIEVKHENGSGSSSINYATAKELYENLKGVEKLSYIQSWPSSKDVNVAGKMTVEARTRAVDNVYWEIFDYHFDEGKPFDREAAEAGTHQAVITRQLATSLFGKDGKAEGETIYVDMVPYTVAGVVDNVNPLLSQSYADMFIPIGAEGLLGPSYDEIFGDVGTVMLMEKGVTREQLAEQVKARYATLNSRLKEQKQEAVYHEQPFNAEAMGMFFGSNNSPDIKGACQRRVIVYVLLLLLPAINLSTMTRSRLRRRVAEIGVRRAFGCRRVEVLWQLVTENFLVTLAGSVIGLVLSMVFTVFISNYFVDFGGIFNNDENVLAARPTFEMLFTWHSFGFAVLFCFLLNIVSAAVPAWKASGISPAEALSSRGK